MYPARSGLLVSRLVVLSFAFLLFPLPAHFITAEQLSDRMSPALAKQVQTAPDAPVRVWVVFWDKGYDSKEREERAVRLLTDHSRAPDLRKPRRHASTTLDLPVCEDYVRQLGVSPAERSRWLNAVSIEVRPKDISRLTALPFVKELRLVGKGQDPWKNKGSALPCALKRLGTETQLGSLGLDDQLRVAYGLSYNQNNQIGVIDLHRLGYTGAGIKVAMLDSGYRTNHPATKPIHVLAERDFLFDDDDVDNEPEDDARAWLHGTLTLSILAGYDPGQLVGVAYKSDYLLAKTEDIRAEYPLEEDHYVAGLEWAESMGADVCTASLAYGLFDGDVGYGATDLDGNTTLCAIATGIAVSRGMVVLNAAGNTGPAPGTIESPADAESVIAVGAVDSSGAVMEWSSRGPTADGRAKPDVVALGWADFGADPWTGEYLFTGGTSMSTPLVAGVVALLLEAHPDWTPFQVRHALTTMATRYTWYPDNNTGYGLVNAAFSLEFGGAKSPAHYSTPFFLLEPAEAESVISWPPTFRWESSRSFKPGDTIRYALLVSEDHEFASTDTIFTGPDTVWTPSSLSPPSGGNFYWDVVAINDEGLHRTSYLPRSLRVSSGSATYPHFGPEPFPPVEDRIPEATEAASEDPSPWWPGFGGRMINGPLLALIPNPSSPGSLILSGTFTSAFGEGIKNLLEWDGNRALPVAAVDGTISRFAVHDHHLVAAGNFKFNYGDITMSGVAQLYQAQWFPLAGQVTGTVMDVIEHSGRLYIGGNLSGYSCGALLHGVAVLENECWQPVGFPLSEAVRALGEHEGRLMAATSKNVGLWDGTSWSFFPQDLTLFYGDTGIETATSFQGSVVVGGMFGGYIGNIASWDGTAWHLLGGGVNGKVKYLKAVGDSLFVAGHFTQAGGVKVNGLGIWNGTEWRDAGLPPDVSANMICVEPGRILVAAQQALYNGAVIGMLFEWDGRVWRTVNGQGLNARASCFAEYGGALAVGGLFTTASYLTVNHIALWDGTWHSLGSGVNDRVWALAVHDGRLVAGGAFTEAGGQRANRVALWNGSQWEPLGSGMDLPVYTLFSRDGVLYAGGAFTQADGNSAQHVASWDGSRWNPLGSGVDDWVLDLAAYNGEIVAGGFFRNVGDQPAARVAAWNGTSWRPLASGIESWGSVGALEVYNGCLVAAGNFRQLEWASRGNIARWDGQSWESMGIGVSDVVLDLLSYGGNLYVTGEFTRANGDIGTRTARWDGSWHALEGGSVGGWIGSYGAALGVYEGDIFVGGDFSNAGGGPSSYIARWRASEIPVPVEFESFMAERVSAGVSIRWVVRSAEDLTSFHVYQETGGAKIRLTNTALSGQKEYSFLDPQAPLIATAYWVKEISRSGDITWHGPVWAPAVAAKLQLSQNQPNPVRASTSMEFNLPRSGAVKLTLFDLSGRKVAEPLNQTLPAGVHRVNWDGRTGSGQRAAPGMYIYRLVTPDGVLSRKLVVIPEQR
jgi:trimeric autotransporter adhesin